LKSFGHSSAHFSSNGSPITVSYLSITQRLPGLDLLFLAIGRHRPAVRDIDEEAP
jgi:hypothetical protein